MHLALSASMMLWNQQKLMELPQEKLVMSLLTDLKLHNLDHLSIEKCFAFIVLL
jgi:hypothetical protein